MSTMSTATIIHILLWCLFSRSILGYEPVAVPERSLRGHLLSSKFGAGLSVLNLDAAGLEGVYAQVRARRDIIAGRIGAMGLPGPTTALFSSTMDDPAPREVPALQTAESTTPMVSGVLFSMPMISTLLMRIEWPNLNVSALGGTVIQCGWNQWGPGENITITQSTYSQSPQYSEHVIPIPKSARNISCATTAGTVGFFQPVDFMRSFYVTGRYPSVVSSGVLLDPNIVSGTPLMFHHLVTWVLGIVGLAMGLSYLVVGMARCIDVCRSSPREKKPKKTVVEDPLSLFARS